MKTKTTHFGSIAAKILAVVFGLFVMDVSARAIDKVTVDNVNAEANSTVNLDDVGCSSKSMGVSVKTESTISPTPGVPNSLPVTSATLSTSGFDLCNDYGRFDDVYCYSPFSVDILGYGNITTGSVDFQLTEKNSLKSAKLTGDFYCIDLTNYFDVYNNFTMRVDVKWTGTGAISKEHSISHIPSPGMLVINESTGKFRPAVASITGLGGQFVQFSDKILSGKIGFSKKTTLTIVKP